MFLTNVAYASAAGHHAGPLFSIGPLEVTSEITTMWGVLILILLVSFIGTRNMQRIPSGLQNVLEMGIEMYENFWTDILGKKRTRELMPFLATFFILILCSNYSGLLPLAGTLPGLKPPTSNVSTTAGLAIVVFFLVLYYNLKVQGPIGYIKHLIGPMPAIAFLMLPLNIVEQFTRPLSLALRLYGSVYGEEMVVASLAALCPLVLPLTMQVMGILFGAIQAFVFTLLASIYLEEATAVHH